jgi:hypothetical protein
MVADDNATLHPGRPCKFPAWCRKAAQPAAREMMRSFFLPEQLYKRLERGDERI